MDIKCDVKMAPPLTNQILQVLDLSFRVLRKTKAGTYDLVVFTGTGTINIRVAGIIDINTVGFCHLEFNVASADCVVTTLNDTALNINNSCGYICFKYKDREAVFQTVYVAITDFLQESSNNNYNFYVNGNSSAQKLPDLFNS